MNGKHFIGDQQLSKNSLGAPRRRFVSEMSSLPRRMVTPATKSCWTMSGERGWPNAGGSSEATLCGSLWLLEECGHGGGLVPPKKQKPTPKRQIFKEELRCQAESGSTQSNRTAASNPEEEGDPLLPS